MSAVLFEKCVPKPADITVSTGTTRHRFDEWMSHVYHDLSEFE